MIIDRGGRHEQFQISRWPHIFSIDDVFFTSLNYSVALRTIRFLQFPFEESMSCFQLPLTYYFCVESEDKAPLVHLPFIDSGVSSPTSRGIGAQWYPDFFCMSERVNLFLLFCSLAITLLPNH